MCGFCILKWWPLIKFENGNVFQKCNGPFCASIKWKMWLSKIFVIVVHLSYTRDLLWPLICGKILIRPCLKPVTPCGRNKKARLLHFHKGTSNNKRLDFTYRMNIWLHFTETTHEKGKFVIITFSQQRELWVIYCQVSCKSTATHVLEGGEAISLKIDVWRVARFDR